MQASLLEHIVSSAELSSSLGTTKLTLLLKDLELLQQYTLTELSQRGILTRELLEDDDIIGFHNPAGVSYLGATILYHFLKKKLDLTKYDFANVIDQFDLHKHFFINGQQLAQQRVIDIIDHLERTGAIQLKNWELAIEDLPKVLREIEGYVESRAVLRLISEKDAQQEVEVVREQQQAAEQVINNRQLGYEYLTVDRAYKIAYATIYNHTGGRRTARPELRQHILTKIPVYRTADGELCFTRVDIHSQTAIYLQSEKMRPFLKKRVRRAKEEVTTQKKHYPKEERDHVPAFNHATAVEVSAQKYQELLASVAQDYDSKMFLRSYRKDLAQRVIAALLVDDGLSDKQRAVEYLDQAVLEKYVRLNPNKENIIQFIESFTQLVITRMFSFTEHDVGETAQQIYGHLDATIRERLTQQAFDKAVLAYVNGKRYTRKHLFEYCLDELVEDTFGIQARLIVQDELDLTKRFTIERLQTSEGEKKIVSRHDPGYMFPTQAIAFMDVISSRYTQQKHYAIDGVHAEEKIIIPPLEKQQQILPRLQQFFAQVSHTESQRVGKGCKTALKYDLMQVLAATVEYLQQHYDITIEHEILAVAAEYKTTLLPVLITANDDNLPPESLRIEVQNRINRLPRRQVTPRYIQERYALEINRDQVEIFLGEYLDARGVCFKQQDKIIGKVLDQYQLNVVRFSTNVLVYKVLCMLEELPRRKN